MSTYPRTDAVADAIGKSGTDWHHSATLMRQFTNVLEAEVTALRKELAQVTADFQSECDHDFERVDASFDHAFGTEVIRYLQCEKCGKQAEWDEVDHDDEPPERDRDEPDYTAEKTLTPLENHQRNDEHSKLL